MNATRLLVDDYLFGAFIEESDSGDPAWLKWMHRHSINPAHVYVPSWVCVNTRLHRVVYTHMDPSLTKPEPRVVQLESRPMPFPEYRREEDL